MLQIHSAIWPSSFSDIVQRHNRETLLDISQGTEGSSISKVSKILSKIQQTTVKSSHCYLFQEKKRNKAGRSNFISSQEHNVFMYILRIYIHRLTPIFAPVYELFFAKVTSLATIPTNINGTNVRTIQYKKGEIKTRYFLKGKKKRQEQQKSVYFSFIFLMLQVILIILSVLQQVLGTILPALQNS